MVLDGLFARRLALLEALGSPQAAFPVVHVAGTNGKGSTVAMVAQGLLAAGVRVGRFTSPDLHGPHERFWLAGAVMAPAEYAERWAAVESVAARVALDFPELLPWRPFDLWCALAWTYFREVGAELVVVETGMGGARDATNVLPTKVLTLITAIGLDHALCWGGDLASVAREKAGIMRPNVPAMTTATGEAFLVLQSEADCLGAPLKQVAPFEVSPYRLALPGAYQLENAALAAAGLAELAAQGWQISENAVRAGLEDVSWPGRLETIDGTWLLDGAHNPEAVAALVSSWQAPEVVIVAIQKTKDARPMVEQLSRGGRPLLLLTMPDAEYWDPVDLASWAEGPVHVAEDARHALDLARELAPEGLRAVTGSIYLVAECRELLGATRVEL